MLPHLLGLFTGALTLVTCGVVVYALYSAARYPYSFSRPPIVPRLSERTYVIRGDDYAGLI